MEHLDGAELAAGCVACQGTVVTLISSYIGGQATDDLGMQVECALRALLIPSAYFKADNNSNRVSMYIATKHSTKTFMHLYTAQSG